MAEDCVVEVDLDLSEAVRRMELLAETRRALGVVALGAEWAVCCPEGHTPDAAEWAAIRELIETTRGLLDCFRRRLACGTSIRQDVPPEAP